ncbi:MAG: hypothetical protein P4L74_04085 [Candidatus Doudnabacteria bacterium]|nr:hypothetical protein [Candidatus Doudnabacteria bacterium]
MELSPDQQIFSLIKKSQKVLIALPDPATTDALASALALRLFLLKLQKDVVVAGSGKQAGESLQFLPDVSAVKSVLEGGKSLVITVDTSQKKLAEISYQTGELKAQVFLKSKDGEFTPEDLSFAQEKFPLDLIITVGAKSLENLGRLHEQNADLFYETPKINLDVSAANEYFGSVNLVDVTATSIAELLADLMQKYEEQLIDQDIATCLLAGIIEQTGSFQRAQTTPKAFIKASELVALGGRQQEVIKNIFKTKPLSLLKLWGRALARMKIDERQKTVISLLTAEDFVRAEAGVKYLLPALKEMSDNLGDYSVIAIIAEPAKGRPRLLAAVHQQFSAKKLLSSIDGSGQIVDAGINNFAVIEMAFSDILLETLEERFSQAVKNLDNSQKPA